MVSLSLAFGDRDLGQEAADEAIVRAFEEWNEVRDMKSPNGWTYRVGYNVARRKVRRRAMERRLLLRGRPEDDAAPAGEMWLVVAELPERQRHAVVLRHLGQLGEAEIGSVMGITRGTVSATLRTAYASLKTSLTEPVPALELP